MTAALNKETVQQYQAELEQALKRYQKASEYASQPPEVRVGQSPRALIWTRNKARLYYYLPQGAVRYREPLLFIYSLINKAFILDLRPGSSLLEFLVKQGYAVYLLDWGEPGLEDKAMLLDDYVLDYLPKAVKHTLRHAKAEKLSLLGYCLGGVLTMAYAATHPDAPIKNLVTFTVPLDYSDPNLANGWFKRESLPLNQVLEAYGNVPGEFLDLGMRLKDPVPGFITVYTGFYDKVLDERAVISWLSLQKWMSETVPFAGAAFKQWVDEMWLGNKLVKSALTLRNRRVDLAQIKMSYLNVLAEQDLIVPNSQSSMALEVVGSADKEQVILPGGHIGLAVGRVAVKGLWPKLDSWLEQRSTLIQKD